MSVPSDAGSVNPTDSDAVLMAKAKELQDRAKAKAESLDRFEKSTRERKDYR